MRIEYEITPEDWAAFAEYLARTSSPFRRATRSGVITGILLFMLGATTMGLVRHSIVWPALGVCAAIFWAWHWPRQVVKNARALMAGKDQPCLRGRHIMEALPDGLRAKCDVTDSTVAWAGIRKVIQTPSHIFVMLEELRGYVVPKKLVLSGELEPFIQAIEDSMRLSSSGNGRTAKP